jgi:hypothetical protein
MVAPQASFCWPLLLKVEATTVVPDALSKVDISLNVFSIHGTESGAKDRNFKMQHN